MADKKLVEEVVYATQAERLSALKSVMRSYNKESGKTVVQFGDTLNSIEKQLTGVKEVDELLGGGFPCFTAGTKVLCTDKYGNDYFSKNIEDIKVDEYILGFNSNYYLIPSKVVKTHINESSDIWLIKTDKGTVETTGEHPFLTAELQGHRKWVKAKDLNRTTHFYQIPQLERNFMWKKGWLLGFLLGDGNFTQPPKLTYYNNNIELLQTVIKYYKEIYNINLNISNYKNAKNYRISFSNVSVNNILLRDIQELNKIDKNNLDYYRGIVAGLYDADGNQCKYGGMRITSINIGRLQIIKEIIEIFGFKCSIYKSHGGKYGNPKNKESFSEPCFVLSSNKTVKWVLTFLPFYKNNLLSICQKGLDIQHLTYKSAFNKHSNGKKQNNKKVVYNLTTETNTYIANGFPVHNCGIFSVVWGSHGSGKSSLAMSMAAQAQKEGKIVYWIALESFDVDRAKLMGIKLDGQTFIKGEFEKAEDSLDSIIELCKKKLVDVIILDSINSLSPSQELQEKNGDIKSTENDSMALLARKLSQFFRMAVDAVKRSNACVLLIGQTRTSLGYIAIDSLSGGHALLHNSRITIHMRRGQKADSPQEKTKTEEGKTETKQIGFDCVLKLDKVQVTGCKPELTDLHIPFYFASGFNKVEEVTVDMTKMETIDIGADATIPSSKEEVTVVMEKGVVPSKPTKKRGRPSKKEN